MKLNVVLVNVFGSFSRLNCWHDVSDDTEAIIKFCRCRRNKQWCCCFAQAHKDGSLQQLLSGESDKYEYDLIVIGGGSGGLACSKVAQLSHHVALLCNVVVRSQFETHTVISLSPLTFCSRNFTNNELRSNLFAAGSCFFGEEGHGAGLCGAHAKRNNLG